MEETQSKLEENEAARKRLQGRLESLSRQMEEGQGDRERLVEQLENLRGQVGESFATLVTEGNWAELTSQRLLGLSLGTEKKLAKANSTHAFSILKCRHPRPPIFPIYPTFCWDSIKSHISKNPLKIVSVAEAEEGWETCLPVVE